MLEATQEGVLVQRRRRHDHVREPPDGRDAGLSGRGDDRHPGLDLDQQRIDPGRRGRARGLPGRSCRYLPAAAPPQGRVNAVGGRHDEPDH